MGRGRLTVFALLAMALGSAAIVTSGAFTSVAAERGVDVNVSGDASALLQLEPHSGSNGQGGYASITNGQLELHVDGTNTPGSGVNVNALTRIERVFNVTNAGTQPVGVWIVKSGSNANLVTFEDETGTLLDNSSTNAITIAPGETIEVGLEIDTRNSGVAPNTTILDGITIHADADEA